MTAPNADISLFDVWAVSLTDYKVRLLAKDKTMRNAEAIQGMAAIRRGTDEEIYVIETAGQFGEGDTWRTPA